MSALQPETAGAQAQVPPAAESVRLLVKGDWGTGSAAQAAVSRRMCAGSVAFSSSESVWQCSLTSPGCLKLATSSDPVMRGAA